MGMDGLSMANTGALKESTSADLTSRAEQIVHTDPKNDSKQIQNLETNRAIKNKDDDQEDSKNGKQQTGKRNDEEEFQDGLVEDTSTDDNEEEIEDFNIEDLDNPDKEFYVKLNAKDDIIELYDNSSDRLIETISGNELQGLVKKLNMASGIFVNKRV